MKNNFLNKISSRFWRNVKLALVLLSVCLSGFSLAQEHHQDALLKISYTEKANVLLFPEDTYTIYTSSGSVLETGIGYSVRDYVFTVPGTYTVEVGHPHTQSSDSCNHSFPNRWIIEVANTKFNIDFQNITLSRPIRVNQSTEGTTMSIPVFVSSYNNQPVEFRATTVKTAGIGTNVIGTLQGGAQSLSQGNNVLVYHLSGVVTQDTYIMFDIIDDINRVHGWSLPYKVQ